MSWPGLVSGDEVWGGYRGLMVFGAVVFLFAEGAFFGAWFSAHSTLVTFHIW